MPAIVAAPPGKPPFDDDESRRIKAYLIHRAMVHLAAAVAAAPNGRAEVHIVIVGRDKTLTLESYIEPSREHPPDRRKLARPDSDAKTA